MAITKRKQISFKWPATFRALAHRNYRIWFVGQGISLVGTWMQTMAQQVLVFRLTGSAAALGIVSFIGLIPLIPLSLWGGSLSDRISKKKVILGAQVLMLIQALILSFLTWTNQVDIWHVYILSFFLGAANAVDMPARQSFTVEMVEGKDDLTNAIGLNSAIFNGARAIGPALAGIVVAATGEGMAFFLNGLTFIAVIISLLLMKNLPQPAAQNKEIKIIRHLQEGMSFVFKQRTITVLISLVAVSAFLSMPYNTLMPVFAENVLKESSKPVIDFVCGGPTPIIQCQAPEALPLGILLTTIGIGALFGAVMVASFSPSARRGRMLTIGNIAFPLFLILMAISRSFPLSCVLLFGVGVSFVLQNALVNTLLQLATPDHIRGRVMSLYTMVFQTTMRLGGMQAGFTADIIGAPLSLGIGAVFSLIYGCFVAIRYPVIRKM